MNEIIFLSSRILTEQGNYLLMFPLLKSGVLLVTGTYLVKVRNEQQHTKLTPINYPVCKVHKVNNSPIRNKAF